jgi:hypothetical protein
VAQGRAPIDVADAVLSPENEFSGPPITFSTAEDGSLVIDARVSPEAALAALDDIDLPDEPPSTTGSIGGRRRTRSVRRGAPRAGSPAPTDSDLDPQAPQGPQAPHVSPLSAPRPRGTDGGPFSL